MSKKIETISKKVQKFLTTHPLPEINSMNDYTKAGDVLKVFKIQLAKVEEFRKIHVGPLNDKVKTINTKFKEVTNPLNLSIETIETLMKKFYVEEKTRKDAEQARLDEAAASQPGTNGVLVPIVNEIASQRGDLATSTMRTITRWRLMDITMVPLEYLAVDDKRITALIKEKKPAPAGIEYYEDLSLMSR